MERERERETLYFCVFEAACFSFLLWGLFCSKSYLSTSTYVYSSRMYSKVLCMLLLSVFLLKPWLTLKMVKREFLIPFPSRWKAACARILCLISLPLSTEWKYRLWHLTRPRKLRSVSGFSVVFPYLNCPSLGQGHTTVRASSCWARTPSSLNIQTSFSLPLLSIQFPLRTLDNLTQPTFSLNTLG